MSVAIDELEPENNKGFFGHPWGLSTLFLTEMWERFSFYGIRPLLTLFMAAAMIDGGFGFERSQATAIVGIYSSSVYLASLPGGWIADRLLGLRRAILYGAILISLGHISIGLSGFSAGKTPFFLGLILIVLGTGLLKPNISAIVGDLYPEGGARRDAGFSIFYMGINTGAFFAPLITGLLGEKYGWHLGFGAAGVGMLIGLAVYILRSKSTLGNLGMEPTKHPDPVIQASRESQVKIAIAAGLGIIGLVVILAFMGLITLDAQVLGKYMAYVLVGIAVVYFAYLFIAGGLSSDEKKRVMVIGVLFIAAAIFWGAFEQAPTSLGLFAKDFTDRNFFGFEIPATWLQAVNSLFIIILAPVFAVIWTGLAKRGIDFSSPAKFALGLAFAALGFIVMIFAANIVVGSNGAVKVSMMWLVVTYLFHTFGELCLSPVGLSSMTKLSPRRYVGQMMGIWFLAASLGNLIAGLVGGSVDPEKLDQMPKLFTWTTIFLVASAIVLALLAIPISKMMRNVSDEEKEIIEEKGTASL
jgi:proton-dependent oligopeptide transporter, POT family